MSTESLEGKKDEKPEDGDPKVKSDSGDKLLEKIAKLQSEVDRKETVIQGLQFQSKQVEALKPILTDVIEGLKVGLDEDVLELISAKPLPDQYEWLKRFAKKQASASEGEEGKQSDKPRQTSPPLRDRAKDARPKVETTPDKKNAILAEADELAKSYGRPLRSDEVLALASRKRK